MKKLFILSIFPIILGTSIYILFRNGNLLIFKWLEILRADYWVFNIRKYTIPMRGFFPKYIIYNVPDGLYIFAFTNFLLFMNNRLKWYQMIFVGSIPFIVFSISELFQYYNIISGTFDILDIIFYKIGFILALFINILIILRRQRNEIFY